MATIAILPIKSFFQAKQRLRHELPEVAVRSLAAAMFTDVLLALSQARVLDEIYVVTRDLSAQKIATGHGARILDDTEHDHNAAAEQGIRRALRAGAGRVVLVPGDCPLLDPAELEALLRRTVSRSAVIVPDRHGTGTNALVLSPPDSLKPAFGADSCRRHAGAARTNGSSAEVVGVPSLALDVDTPDDLEAVRATLARTSTPGLAAHTRVMLSQIVRSQV